MESLRSASVAKVIRALYERGTLYTTEISYETRVSERHLSVNVLPEMLKDEIVRSTSEKNKKYYELTDKGKILALALFDTENLVDAYRKGNLGT